MVEEAAYELRLGIVNSDKDEQNRWDDDDLGRAIQTLLDFGKALNATKELQTERIQAGNVRGNGLR